jgi:ribonuclease Z
MTASRISRAIVSLASLFFAALALGIWAMPELIAGRLGVEAVRAAGGATLRADFGGLFAGLAILCGVAAMSGRQAWITAATAMLGAIVTGRAIAWVSAGRIGGDLVEMGIELVILGALLSYARATDRAASGTAVVPAGRRHRGLIAAAVLAIPVAGMAVFSMPGVQQRIFDAGAERLASRVNTAPLADDALRVAVCGSSAPLPSASRAKACVAVFAGGKFYIVDAGPESVENLMLWTIPMGSVGGVLLTHFHSDHIGDLGELNLQTWVGGRTGPLDVYGGPGIEQVVAGFSQAYHLDQGYRTAHHGENVMPTATWPMVAHTITLEGPETPEKGRTAVVLERDGLRITAVEVDHTPISPAYAYRFDYKGRSAFVTGDLKFHPTLIEGAKGVDLMLSEAIAVQMTRALGKGATSAGRSGTAAVMHDIEDYHITPQQAAEVANGAQARLLAFYHLLPAPDNALARRVFARGVDEARRGDWTIAEDGSLYTMPLGSDVVQIGSLSE